MQKLLTVINPAENIIMRIRSADFEEYRKKGYRPTTKGKLKSFLNREVKLWRNKRTIETIEKLQKHPKKEVRDKAPTYKTQTDQDNGKIYVIVTRHHRRSTENQKLIIEWPSNSPYRL